MRQMASSTHATVATLQKDMTEMHDEMMRLDSSVKDTEKALEDSDKALHLAKAQAETKGQVIDTLEKG